MPPSLREVAERSEDGGSVVCTVGHSPSHGSRRASPLSEGAKKCRRKGERYMKANNIDTNRQVLYGDTQPIQKDKSEVTFIPLLAFCRKEKEKSSIA